MAGEACGGRRYRCCFISSDSAGITAAGVVVDATACARAQPHHQRPRNGRSVHLPCPCSRVAERQRLSGKRRLNPASPCRTWALTELSGRRQALLAGDRRLEAAAISAPRLAGHRSLAVDAIARRLKGFQDYLVVALQDLASRQSRLIWRVRPLQLQPSPSIKCRTGGSARSRLRGGPWGAVCSARTEALDQRPACGAFKSNQTSTPIPGALAAASRPPPRPLLKTGSCTAGARRGAQASAAAATATPWLVAAALPSRRALRERFSDPWVTGRQPGTPR